MRKFNKKYTLLIMFICFFTIVSTMSVYASEESNKKITLGFDMITTRKSNELRYIDKEDYLLKNSKEQGINVLAPTWFYLDGDINDETSIAVKEKADKNYVELAHKNGYKVWAVFGECNREIGETNNYIERASKVFNNPSLQTKIINQVVQFAKEYKVDGINMDFEGLGKQNKDGFTRFVKELYTKLKEEKIILSVDVNKAVKPSIYSEMYDRAELAKNSDYLVLMAYDEHYGGSDPGSVGSYKWVDETIREFLDMGISSEKLILGIPFYSIDYAVQVSGDTYKVAGYNNVLQKDQDKLIETFKSDSRTITYYDSNSGQTVLEYYKKDRTGTVELKHLVWLENEDSIKWRMELINNYKLAGAAAWKLYTEKSDTWSIINKYLNVSSDNAREKFNKVTSDVNKVWSVSFNKPIDIKTIENNVIVKDSQENIIAAELKLGSEGKVVSITPKNSYKKGETYYIYINNNIKSIYGQIMNSNLIAKFQVQ